MHPKGVPFLGNGLLLTDVPTLVQLSHSQLDVHLLQGLLHMLDLTLTASDQSVPVANQRAQSPDLLRRTKGGVEQAVGMQLLDPLPVQDVGLAPCIHQVHLEAALF